MIRLACALLFLFLAGVGLRAQTIVPIIRYDYITPPHLPDSQRDEPGALTGELTDLVSVVQAWNTGGVNFSATPFVGWLDTNARIRFQFATPVSLSGATFHFADNNGNLSAVYFPEWLHLSIDGSSAPFHSQPVDPMTTGFATGIGFLIGGFVTDHVILEVPHRLDRSDWSMMTEASFTGSAVPEPSTYAAFAGIGALGFAWWRRRRVASATVC